MRLAIISDIHANLQALRAVLRAIAGQGVDGVVCLGDIVGYNANPAECIALVRHAGVACVAGNHDRAVAGQIPIVEFSGRATRAVEWTRKELSAGDLSFLASLPTELQVGDCLLAVHGALAPAEQRETLHMRDPESRRPSFRALGARASAPGLCAFGNTHVAGIYEFHGGEERALPANGAALRRDALYLINPGTVGEPRTRERRATFMVLDSARRTVGLQYAEYEYAAAARSTRAAGLGRRAPFVPAMLRPILGRCATRLGLVGSRPRPRGATNPSPEPREGGPPLSPSGGGSKTTESRQ
jgi:predicted phosphodiesterase